MDKQITVEERNRTVLENYRNFPNMENLAQDPRILETILEIARQGIWGKLNDLTNIDQAKPIIFTGQQPTLDYGLYRRVAKRTGAHESGITVHTHADHDKAKKSGFGVLKIPIINNHGILEYQERSLFNNFDEDDIMAEVVLPSIDEVNNFFQRIIKDLNATILTAQIDYPDSFQGLNTVILEECRVFITENYHLIRSAAELNAVIQSFLIKKLDPKIQTIDIMLSDFLNSQIVREAFADQIKQLPNWILAYNIATDHVNKTEYKDEVTLPKALSTAEGVEGKYFELPLWILDETKSSGRSRFRAWMINQNGLIKIGKMVGSQFEVVVEIPENDPVENIVKLKGFEKLSPAAITLVDILRIRLKLATIHGLTGHYYESVNEITQAILNNIAPINGMVMDPNSEPTMAPITSASYENRKRGLERLYLTKQLNQLEVQLDKAKNLLATANSTRADSFPQLTNLQLGVARMYEVDNIKIKAIDIPGLNTELTELSTRDNNEDFFISEMINKFFSSKKVNSLTLLDIMERLYSASSQFNEKEFGEKLVKYKLINLKNLWENMKGWVEIKTRLKQISERQSGLKLKVDDINSQIQKINKLLNEQDTPLVTAAVLKPTTVPAMRRKIYSKANQQIEA